MKQIVCEMCGSTEFAKDDGYFVCQSCGMKYSVDEAKKIMVEIEGVPQKAIKNSHSEEIERLLKNADATISTGNMKAAYDLYTQVLTLDPDNIMAQVQRMGCQMTQGDVTNTHIDELDNTMICALKNNLVKKGESKEFFESSFEAIKMGNELIMGVYKICVNFYEANYNKSKNSGIAIGAASLLLGGGIAGAASVIGSAGKMTQLESMIQTQSVNCFNATLHICNFMLNDVKNYGNSSPEMWQYLSNMADNMVQYANYISKNQRSIAINGANDLRNRILEVSEKAEEQIKELVDKTREEYWTNHVDEKNKLENEKRELENKRELLLSNVEVIENNVKYNEIMESIGRLKEKHKKLGLFAGKEKRILQTEINTLQSDIESISNKVNQANEEINAEISMINDRIFEIDSEFEKDRR